MIEILDTVALNTDLPDYGLRAGNVGTVVEKLGDGHFEVEFSDNNGETYAELAIDEDSLIPLRYTLAEA